jgi:hypothetical protein
MKGYGTSIKATLYLRGQSRNTFVSQSTGYDSTSNRTIMYTGHTYEAVSDNGALTISNEANFPANTQVVIYRRGRLV